MQATERCYGFFKCLVIQANVDIEDNNYYYCHTSVTIATICSLLFQVSAPYDAARIQLTCRTAALAGGWVG